MSNTIPSQAIGSFSGAEMLGKVQSVKQAGAAGEGRATLDSALELRDKFTTTFGTVLYGQMIKSMRSTVGKPAYFHGGQAEEMFRGQLDQLMSEEMAEASGDRLVNPMFERKFPEWAAVIKENESQNAKQPSSGLDDLAQLPRR